MEDMHYVMINVEKTKKKMLCMAEGFEDPYLDYSGFNQTMLKI